MDTLQQRLHQMSELAQRARAIGLSMRPQPPQPTSCCGRGCNGCVWEGYYSAVDYWCEDAELILFTPE